MDFIENGHGFPSDEDLNNLIFLLALAIDDDIEKTEGERLDIFEKFVKSKLILGIETKATLEVKDEKEIVTEAERYDWLSILFFMIFK